jgi:peptidoglycan/LPS O-acetylase OafA/YrhL
MKEIKGIQGMRGIAAIMVLLFHIAGFYPTLNSLAPFLLQFYSGVSLFFVISGFILTKKFLSGDYKVEGGGRRHSLAIYYIRRIFRIWPLYYFGIFLFAVTPVVAFPSNQAGIPITWQAFLFMQNYFVSTYRVYPLWTLVVEELFYLILPLWLIAFRKNAFLSLAGVASLSSAWMLYLHFAVTPYFVILDIQFPCYALCYALGTFAALGYTLKLNKLYVAGIAAVAFSYPTTEGSWFQPLVFAVVYYLILCNFMESKLFTNRVNHWIGSLTYPLYLISLPCLILSTEIFGRAEFYYWIPLTFALAFAGSYLLHVFVEKPFIGMGRKIETRLRERIGNEGVIVASRKSATAKLPDS